MSLPSVATIAPPAPITAPRSAPSSRPEDAPDDRADTGAGSCGACFFTNAAALEHLSGETAHLMHPSTHLDLVERERQTSLPVDPSRPLHVGNDATDDGPCGNEHAAVLHRHRQQSSLRTAVRPSTFPSSRGLQSHVEFLADRNDSWLRSYPPAPGRSWRCRRRSRRSRGTAAGDSHRAIAARLLELLLSFGTPPRRCLATEGTRDVLLMGCQGVSVVAQQTSHFFVGGLIEVEVPLSDGSKRLRCADADDLIGNRR